MSGGGIKRRGVLGGVALLMAAQRPSFAAAGKPRVLVRTARGALLVELEAQKAPITSANFLHYVDAEKYDGGSFFRAARTPGAPGQGTIVGGPAAKVRPFPPVAHESTTQTGLRHTTGTLSLGRFEPGSATSGFFICASPEPYLDAHPGEKGDNLGFAAFGHVVTGMDVVRKILAAPTQGKSPFPDQKGQWLTRPVAILSMRRA